MKPKLKLVDNLFSKIVRERDGRCLRCGKTENLQCSHVLPRTYMVTRWNLDNAITLCVGCHLYWWHKNPLEAAAWYEEKFPGRYAELRALALTYKKVNRTDEYERLRQFNSERLPI